MESHARGCAVRRGPGHLEGAGWEMALGRHHIDVKGRPWAQYLQVPTPRLPPVLTSGSSKILPDVPNSPCAHLNPLPPLKSGAPRGSHPSGDLQLTLSPCHTPYAESPTLLVMNTVTTI